MIYLQERDYTILRICYEQRFLTREHIQTFFGAHRSESYRRTGELEKSRFLMRKYYPIAGRNYVMQLTQLGQQLVQDKFGIEFPALKPANLNTLSHDILVTSVRLRLSQFWNATFVPERAIQAKEFPQIADGIFFFPSGKGIAIEVENSDKGRTRFLNRLERWKDTPSIAFILYVTPHLPLFKIISRYLTGGSRQPTDRSGSLGATEKWKASRSNPDG